MDAGYLASDHPKWTHPCIRGSLSDGRKFIAIRAKGDQDTSGHFNTCFFMQTETQGTWRYDGSLAPVTLYGKHQVLDKQGVPASNESEHMKFLNAMKTLIRTGKVELPSRIGGKTEILKFTLAKSK